MSEDKRKNARTQGRYSGGDREYSSRQYDKPSAKTSPADKNKSDKKKPNVGSRSQNKIDLQFKEESNYSFKELEPVKKPEELKFVEPLFILSKTDNGESRLVYDPNFMKLAEADEYLTVLRNSTTWHDKNIVIRNVEYPQPRLVAWYGPHPYTYAGATLEAKEMPGPIREIKQKVEANLRQHGIHVELNSVLLNLYRNEKDSVSWHSDDELTLGVHPTIASVSLGETRKFELRSKGHVTGMNSSDILYVNLTHGSLIVMDGCMQKDWQHRVPKEYHDRSERINLTFRTIYPIDQLPPEMPYVSNSMSTVVPGAKVIHQQDPKFDTENFPPLGMETNDKKTKFLPKENETKVYQKSGYQRKFLKVEHWDGEDAEKTQEIQNNLSEKSSPSLNSNSSNPCQTDINLNVKESDKICNKQFSPKDFIPSKDLMDDFESNQSHKSNESCLFQSKDSSPSKSSLEKETEPAEIKAKVVDSRNKCKLNADAPDFVPQKKFEKFWLTDFAEHCRDLENEDLHSFAKALFKCLEKNQSHFLNRDFYELEVYNKLTEDGSLNDEHLKIILKRIGSMITNAFYKKNEARYRNPSRSFNDNNYQKYRQSYGNSARY